MKTFYTFSRTDSLKGRVNNPNGSVSEVPYLRFAPVVIYPNKKCTEVLNLDSTSKIIITQNELDEKEMYIRKAEKDERYTAKITNKGNGGYGFQNKAVNDEVRKILGCSPKDVIILFVEATPTNVNGVKYHKINLDNPKKIIKK